MDSLTSECFMKLINVFHSYVGKRFIFVLHIQSVFILPENK